MPTPILKIPVDDDKFQKFLASFKKFQDALVDMPDAWKEINAGIAENAEKGAAAAGSTFIQINATRQLLNEEDKRDAAQKRRDDAERKRAKEREQEARDQADREKEALDRRQQAVSQLRSHAETVTSFVRNIGGGNAGGLAAGIGGVLGEAGEALAGGAYEIAKGQRDRFLTAGGLGISTGELQGTQDYMGTAFGDTTSMMDRILRAKGSPSQWSTFGVLGMPDFRTKDPAQLLPEALVKARRLYLATHGNYELLASMGVGNLFTQEELQNATQFSEADILGKGKRSAEWAKKYGVSADASKHMIDLVSSIDATTDRFKNGLVVATDAVIAKFNALAGVSGTNHDPTAKFSPTDPRHYFYVHPRGGGPRILPPDTTAGLPWYDKLFNLHKAGEAPMGTVAGGQGTVAATRAYFMAQGWSAAQADGITANLLWESGLNASKAGDNGQAFGAAQWHKDRQELFAKVFGFDIHKASYAQQLAFVQWELTHGRGGAHLYATKNPYDAGAAVSHYYESPLDDAGEQVRRGQLAEKLAKVLDAHKPAPRIKTKAPGGGAGGDKVTVVVRDQGSSVSSKVNALN